MKPPCEIVVSYVIPAIRSELAKDLISLGMKQRQVSELMNITQPAVSQYLSDKRGNGVKLNDSVKDSIAEFAVQLADGTAEKIDIIGRICSICRQIETKDVLEQLGVDSDNLNESCHVCITSNQCQ